MFASFTVRRSVVATAIASAFLAIPTLAFAAASSTTTRADLAGSEGFCEFYDSNTLTSPTVGNVQIATSQASSPGFHAVNIAINIRPGQVPAGAYDIWLVNLYRDDAGQVTGCAASPLPNQMTVKGGRVSFRGSAERYTGEYELQVYIGPLSGPGYGSAPSTVYVP